MDADTARREVTHAPRACATCAEARRALGWEIKTREDVFFPGEIVRVRFPTTILARQDEEVLVVGASRIPGLVIVRPTSGRSNSFAITASALARVEPGWAR